MPSRHDAFAAVYRAHHEFVWSTLRHLGVDLDRIDDALQDTFLVVYRRLGEFAGRSSLRTWIFEVARRVAARYRRVAAREAPRRCELPELPVAPRLEEEIARAEAAEILREFLERLDPDKSVVFMMAELEQLRAPEIAEALGVNLNTVYARLRAARQQLDRLVHRLQTREQRPRIRRAAEVIAAALLVQVTVSARAWARPPAALAAMAEATSAAPTLTPGLAAGSLGGSSTIVAGITLVGVLTLGAAGLLSRPAADHEAAAVTGTTRPRLSDGPGPMLPPEPLRPGEFAALRDPPVPTQQAKPGNAQPQARAPDPTRQAAPGTALPQERASQPTRQATPDDPRRQQRTPEPTRQATPDDPLAQELALIEPARAALLAGDAHRALRLLARHVRRFPASMFAEEVAATSIEALCSLGDGAGARRETTAFTRRWPSSNLAPRVAALCGE
jgi:RNA polymerase sigma-70 factor (ECF subfamily)